MTRTYSRSSESQKTDPLNQNGTRNNYNTPRRTYNCAGYALGTYSWYVPRKKRCSLNSYSFDTQAEAEKKTAYSIKIMLADFPSLRLCNSLDEIGRNETAILFRHSSDGDFHYLKRGKNGIWYHKRGNSHEIDIMPKSQIFGRWCNRYDGPIAIFAMRGED